MTSPLQGTVVSSSWCEEWARESLRVLKPGGHAVIFGGTRTFHRLTCGLEDAGFEIRDCLMWIHGQGFPKSTDVSKAIDRELGADRVGVKAVGNAWSGWGTALKPAWEPIILARKPLSERNIALNGTGAVDVDGCRIASGEFVPAGGDAESHGLGRWPANVILDEDAAVDLDAQAGERSFGAFPARRGPRTQRGVCSGWIGGTTGIRREGSIGGPSRFFLCSKASAGERGHGNNHPTVKPIALMRWLVRLVTPSEGMILDPFAGSGTTGLAAIAEGRAVVLVDRESSYLEIAMHRKGLGL